MIFQELPLLLAPSTNRVKNVLDTVLFSFRQITNWVTPISSLLEPDGMNMIPLIVLALTPFKLVKLLRITPNCLEKYPQVIRLQVDRILFSSTQVLILI